MLQITISCTRKPSDEKHVQKYFFERSILAIVSAVENFSYE